MEFSDGLAVAAIALAFWTILLGILFYKWQSDLAKEMHGLLTKIEGLTTSTSEQQGELFKQLLDFVLSQQRASIGEELEGRVAGIEERVAGLAGGLSPEAKEQMDSLIAEVKREVESLANDIKSLGESAAPQPPLGRSETPFLDKILQEEAYRRWLQKPDVEPTEGEAEK